ncbi:uncharacterized protein MONBRDRAFT_30067 [Monosiga brevicollis MX1]|uniref:Uncharacterized protein n=2 Tax=Monosiga brevicollis TaxID=81824 RepID=A9VCX4_MONBE|nr:uncharacterized protein MONBRDRAFT_30067 [Monosiga brevicollis MX1]EDQ84643.1 predicted protein [Monosiga brevicollis MX1]|eukprot:XP_001750547.1 hypothetical protein [Monosiga brevicollis MX1]
MACDGQQRRRAATIDTFFPIQGTRSVATASTTVADEVADVAASAQPPVTAERAPSPSAASTQAPSSLLPCPRPPPGVPLPINLGSQITCAALGNTLFQNALIKALKEHPIPNVKPPQSSTLQRLAEHLHEKHWTRFPNAKSIKQIRSIGAAKLKPFHEQTWFVFERVNEEIRRASSRAPANGEPESSTTSPSEPITGPGSSANVEDSAETSDPPLHPEATSDIMPSSQPQPSPQQQQQQQQQPLHDGAQAEPEPGDASPMQLLMAFHEHQVQTNRTLDFELCHHARLPCAGSYRTPLASLYLLEGAEILYWNPLVAPTPLNCHECGTQLSALPASCPRSANWSKLFPIEHEGAEPRFASFRVVRCPNDDCALRLKKKGQKSAQSFHSGLEAVLEAMPTSLASMFELHIGSRNPKAFYSMPFYTRVFESLCGSTTLLSLEEECNRQASVRMTLLDTCYCSHVLEFRKRAVQVTDIADVNIPGLPSKRPFPKPREVVANLKVEPLAAVHRRWKDDKNHYQMFTSTYRRTLGRLRTTLGDQIMPQLLQSSAIMLASSADVLAMDHTFKLLKNVRGTGYNAVATIRSNTSGAALAVMVPTTAIGHLSHTLSGISHLQQALSKKALQQLKVKIDSGTVLFEHLNADERFAFELLAHYGITQSSKEGHLSIGLNNSPRQTAKPSTWTIAVPCANNYSLLCLLWPDSFKPLKTRDNMSQ